MSEQIAEKYFVLKLTMLHLTAEGRETFEIYRKNMSQLFKDV